MPLPPLAATLLYSAPRSFRNKSLHGRCSAHKENVESQKKGPSRERLDRDLRRGKWGSGGARGCHWQLMLLRSTRRLLVGGAEILCSEHVVLGPAEGPALAPDLLLGRARADRR